MYQHCELVHCISEEYPLLDQIRAQSPEQVRLETRRMKRKGNLLDIGEENLANLAEQGPQFWLHYPVSPVLRATSRDLARSCAGCEDHGG